MALRRGDSLIAEEGGEFWPHVGSPRRPHRLIVEARVKWLDRKSVRIVLPATRVTLHGRAVILPETRVVLERQSEQLSWETQKMELGEAREWRNRAFYPPVEGRRAAADKASYFTHEVWAAYQAHIGERAALDRDDPRLMHARLLGVALTSDREAVLAAFRAKAKQAHPDGGGSDEAFRRLTEARDALLVKG